MVILIKSLSLCLRSSLVSPLPPLGAYRCFYGSVGRAPGGHVLRQTQHAHQCAERQVGAGPLRHQELHRHQGGHPAVLPGGKVCVSVCVMLDEAAHLLFYTYVQLLISPAEV